MTNPGSILMRMGCQVQYAAAVGPPPVERQPMDSGTKSEQVRHHVLRLVEGTLRPHDKLPTERELAEELAVSRLTIRRVLDGLEHERRVYRIQGAGTFVSESHIAKSLELTSFTEDMRSRGMVPASRLLVAEETTAGARLGQALSLSPAEKVLHMARVRTADGDQFVSNTPTSPAD